MQYEPFIKYAGNPYGAETLRSMLYKPFFDMDLKYRFDPSDFKPAPQARIVLASFERKQFPDVKRKRKNYIKIFLHIFILTRVKHSLQRLKHCFQAIKLNEFGVRLR